MVNINEQIIQIIQTVPIHARSRTLPVLQPIGRGAVHFTGNNEDYEMVGYWHCRVLANTFVNVRLLTQPTYCAGQVQIILGWSPSSSIFTKPKYNQTLERDLLPGFA